MNPNSERPRTHRIHRAAAALGIVVVLALAAAPAQARSRHDHRSRHGHDGARARVEVGHGHGHGHGRAHRIHRHDARVIVGGDYGRYERGPVVRHRKHVRRHVSTRFVVPTRIFEPVRYVEYRHGRVFHAGHGHWHDVYRFPVRTEFGLVWTPYDYCDGHVHARGSFGYDGPRFSLRIGF